MSTAKTMAVRCFHEPCGATEDTWDIESPCRRCWGALSLPRLSCLATPIILVLLTFLMLPVDIVGQSAPPPTESFTEGKRKVSQNLERSAEELAFDYLDFLEQLRRLTNDYSVYIKQLPAHDASQLAYQLQLISRHLQDTAAWGDYMQMLQNLAQWQEELSQREEQLAKVKVRSKPPDYESQEQAEDELAYHRSQLEKLKQEVSDVREEMSSGGDDDLKKDLADLEKEIAEHEAAARTLEASLKTHPPADSEDVSPRLYRLIRNLRRELEVLRDLYQGDVYGRLSENRQLQPVLKEYVRKLAEQWQEGAAAPGAPPGVLVYDKTSGGFSWVRGPASIDSEDVRLAAPGVAVIAPDELPPAVVLGIAKESLPPEELTLPEMPELPAISDQDIGGRQIIQSPRSGEVIVVKELADSAAVTSNKVPIYIMNPVGTLDVVGWDRDWVTAQCQFEISAVDVARAKQLAAKLDLQIYERANGIYVEAVSPALSDPAVRISQNHLTIRVPRANALVVQSSYGAADISQLTGGVRLSGANCAIALHSLSGGVEVASERGPVTASGIEGSLYVRNSSQSVQLTDCDGPIQAENKFALISLRNCRGSARLDNSGPIQVASFDGRVEITNDNGALQLEQIRGDLYVKNALQPVFISDVSGSAKVESDRGEIRAQGVNGQLYAVNNHALITARSLGGPVTLYNRDGQIDLSLEQSLLGPSRVSAQNGVVNLRLRSEVNLLLTVEAVGGSISSSLPVAVEQRGDTRLARLSLGDAANALAITGTNADVVILQDR